MKENNYRKKCGRKATLVPEKQNWIVYVKLFKGMI